MSSNFSTKVTTSGFVQRLTELFGTDEPAVVQRKLGIDYQSAKNYLGGRKPKAEVLEKIVEKTNVSLNWLLLGQGPKYITDDTEFDLDLAIERHDAWRPVLEEWYEYEGREFPEFEGASFMDGWDGLTREKRITALRDLKRVLDHNLRGER